eukprot:TRINITY_DN2494_c0_g1_i4.p1 TRINITY_DN2494_c0_g1~~TRINITY_DN2494_c0_g1_i4.p1  ORF type:complete len:402 (+),score=68.04 TRINITY_DN2494_c0_g1_i4:92-1297(+)
MNVPNDSLVTHLLEAIVRSKCLSQMSVHSAGNILYAAHMGEYKHENLVKKLCDAIVTNGCLESEQTTLESLGSFVHSLGRVNFVSVGTMDAICAAIKRKKLLTQNKQGFRISRAASQLINGFGHLRYRNDEILAGLCNVLKQNIESKTFRNADLIGSIHACSKLCYTNTAFLEAALSKLIGEDDGWEDVDEKMLSGLMWALTVFEILTPQLFQRLALRLKDIMYEARKELKPAQLMQVYQAHFFIQSTYSENFYGDPELNRIVRAARKHRREEYTKKKQIISDFHKDVLETFELIGVPHKREGLIQDRMFQADIRIENEPVVVEVDGRLHFTSNQPYRPIASTVIRNRHLESLGWKIITVPGYEWGELATMEEKKIYMMGKLKDVGIEVPNLPQEILAAEG